jgi:hypothetical protein
VLAAWLAACGSTAATGQTPIVFGITGGNIAPYRVSIQPTGSVRDSSQRSPRRQIPVARVRGLRTEIQQAHLANRHCAGVLPDIASRYIRVGGRTATVHGTCEPGFERVWNDLVRAVGRATG